MMVLSAKRIKQLAGCFLYFVYLLLLTPEILHQSGAAKYAFAAVRGLAGLIAVILLFMNKTKSWMIVNLCLYIVYATLVTIVFNFSVGNIVRIVAIYADIFIICVFTEHLIRNDTKRFLRFLYCTLWIGLVINVATVFLFPNGVIRVANEAGVKFPYYFYDYDNEFIIRYIPTILAIYIYQRYFNHKKKGGAATVAAIVLCIASLVYLGSVASSIVFFLILLGYFLVDLIPEKYINAKTIWVSYMAISLLLAVGNLGLKGSGILDKLGKSQSLQKRTHMWEIAMREIPDSLLFGSGITNSTDMKLHFGYAQLHNSFMTTLLWTGVIGILLYTRFIYAMGSNYTRVQHKREYRFYMVLFTAVLIAALFDGTDLQVYIYIFYIILGNYNSVMALDSMPVPKGKRRIRVVL